MDNEVLVKVENVAKKYCRSLGRSLRYGVQDISAELLPWRRDQHKALRAGEFWALRDVSFELKRGEALGVLGANGAGKSTLLKLLDGLLKPDAGRITMRGQVGALIELGSGFNPILSGRENIYINAAMFGLTKKKTDRVIDDIIEFADIGDFIDSPVRIYSTGMWMRLGFAVATHLQPDVLLVDEVMAVGDLAFRRKCLRHMLNYLQKGGGLVFVSHDPWMIQCVCSRGILFDRGEIVFAGSAVETINRYFRIQLGAGRAETDSKSEKTVSQYFEGLQHMSRSACADKDVQKTMAHPSPILATEDGEISEKQVTPADEEGADESSHRDDLNEENPIAIDKIEISPLYGDRIETGQSARITIHYCSSHGIERVFWGFLIYTRDQLNCITAEATGFSFSDRSFRAVKGRGLFHCTLPRLPLVAGTYVLKAVIGDPRTGVLYMDIGEGSTTIAFTVQTKADEKNNIYAIAESLITMDVQWES